MLSGKNLVLIECEHDWGGDINGRSGLAVVKDVGDSERLAISMIAGITCMDKEDLEDLVCCSKLSVENLLDLDDLDDVTKDRYFVDTRVGCVAVRDRTKVDEYENGLHQYTSGVVLFLMGVADSKNGHSLPMETLQTAQKVCDELNSKQ
jgi:hypothetical protein